LAGARGSYWSGVREKHCWLVSVGLLLEWCERKILLAGWRPLEQNRVTMAHHKGMYNDYMSRIPYTDDKTDNLYNDVSM